MLREPPDAPSKAVPRILAESRVRRFLQLAYGQMSGTVLVAAAHIWLAHVWRRVCGGKRRLPRAG